MIRLVLNVALFALPFVLFFLWLHLKEQNSVIKRYWDVNPVVWIGLFGITVAGAYFLYHLAYQSRDPDVVYVPARVENGVFYPSRMEPRPRNPQP